VALVSPCSRFHCEPAAAVVLAASAFNLLSGGALGDVTESNHVAVMDSISSATTIIDPFIVGVNSDATISISVSFVRQTVV